MDLQDLGKGFLLFAVAAFVLLRLAYKINGHGFWPWSDQDKNEWK
jgi:hypothetical protein